MFLPTIVLNKRESIEINVQDYTLFNIIIC